MGSEMCIRDRLKGKPGPARDITVVNAAGALWVSEIESDLKRAADKCAEAIDSGKALDLLDRLKSATNV